MSDLRITKLILKGLDPTIAQDLVSAGLYTPKLIKAASSQELEDAVGVDNVEAVEFIFNIVRE